MLILFPFIYFYGRYSKSQPWERPLILNSVFIQFAFFIITLLFIGLSIYLLILNWKLLLLFFGIIAILGYISGLLFKNKNKK